MVKRNTSKLAKRRYRVLGILKTLLLIVATGISTPIKADDNELDIDIKGTVYDINQNEVLPTATVYIEELGIGVITDNEGVYRITGIPGTKGTVPSVPFFFFCGGDIDTFFVSMQTISLDKKQIRP